MSLSDDILKVAGLLRKAADLYDAEQTKVAAERTELDTLRKREQARGIAKTAADKGFVDPERADDYAQEILGSSNIDLDALMNKVAASAPRVGFGSPEAPLSSSPATGQDSGQRLLAHLSRHASNLQ